MFTVQDTQFLKGYTVYSRENFANFAISFKIKEFAVNISQFMSKSVLYRLRESILRSENFKNLG